MKPLGTNAAAEGIVYNYAQTAALEKRRQDREVSDEIDRLGYLGSQTRTTVGRSSASAGSSSRRSSILKEAEAGQPVKEICRKYGMSSACYYQWKSKFGGLSVSGLKRNRDLETENAKLERLYAEMALDNHALKDLIEQKL